MMKVYCLIEKIRIARNRNIENSKTSKIFEVVKHIHENEEIKMETSQEGEDSSIGIKMDTTKIISTHVKNVYKDMFETF